MWRQRIVWSVRLMLLTFAGVAAAIDAITRNILHGLDACMINKRKMNIVYKYMCCAREEPYSNKCLLFTRRAPNTTTSSVALHCDFHFFLYYGVVFYVVLRHQNQWYLVFECFSFRIHDYFIRQHNAVHFFHRKLCVRQKCVLAKRQHEKNKK